MPDEKKNEEQTRKFLRETRKAVPKMKEEIKKREKHGETDIASLTVFPNELLDIAKEKEREVKGVPVSCFNCPLSTHHDGNPCKFSSPGLCKEIQIAMSKLFDGEFQEWFGFNTPEVRMFEKEEEQQKEKKDK
ncbi:MAG: hypothetical protein ACUVXA_03950 [Candidatus Jordarchaeum sp.]|uniref:hypothetical protein n=1 Tax=Candidatus Jordarchaeum sp. TaxID=2823881 RepID=UPI00404A1D04